MNTITYFRKLRNKIFRIWTLIMIKLKKIELKIQRNAYATIIILYGEKLGLTS